ncbi:MAG: M1 family metallopeptidase [Anaerolineae bacterium]|nr:M1 family metallopeptidase [Anaerolineae bacterium]
MSKPIRWLCLFVVLAALPIFASASNHTAARSAVQQTLEPTETAVPLVTPTRVPPSPPMVLPAVNWSDVSIHKKAMKPGFEGDVDQFVNANRYLIMAKLTIETDAIIRGAERVRFTNHTTDTLTEIVFRLYPNAPLLAGRMNVTHVTVNNTVVELSLSDLDSAMSVPLDQPLAPGSSVELTLDFNVVMTRGMDASYGRFGFVRDVISATAWYPTISVYEPGSGWWRAMPSPQGDPGYTETGLYDVRLTVPADMTVAMSGTEIETTNNGDGTITHRDVTGPMRDHAFGASTRYMITPTEADGTTINIVHYKAQAGSPLDGTSNAVKYAAFAVQTFNKTFGEYPYGEFDVVQNPTPSGVEFPGLIQIAERSWIQGSSFLETVIAHEIGHQWFYGLVGNNQVEHPWLDESLTSYTEFVYIRAAYPTGSTAEQYVNAFQRRYTAYTGAGQPDQPLDLPVAAYTGLGYGAIVYGKGPLFYVELERQVGRDTVYKALKTYFNRYKYRIVTSADVLHTFEDVSGKDLRDVFRKWVGDFPGLDSESVQPPENQSAPESAVF